jgi:hypothetical protein
MKTLDPSNLVVAFGALTIALALVLVFTAIGSGDKSRGLGTWLLGEVLGFLGLSLPLGVVALTHGRMSIDPIVIPGGFIAASLTLHLFAILRRNGHGVGAGRMLTVSGLVGLATFMICSSIHDAGARARVFHAVLVVLMLLVFPALSAPAKRYKGARMLTAVSLAGAVANAVLLAGTAEPSFSIGQESLHVLFAGLILSSLSALAFLLWLQEELRSRVPALAV